MKKLRKNKKGFTLIEVIVVLVILAIIIALAVPSVMKYVDDANEAKYLAQARAVYIAAEAEITKDYAPDSTLDKYDELLKNVQNAVAGEVTVTSVDAYTVENATSGIIVDESKTKPSLIKSYKIVIDAKKEVIINKNGGSTVKDYKKTETPTT